MTTSLIAGSGTLKNNIDKFVEKVKSVNNSSKEVFDLVIGDDGIFSNINCLFFGENICKIYLYQLF